MSERPEPLATATDRILRDLGRTQITSDEPRLSASEQRALELYDQIKDIQLKQAIINAGPLVNSNQNHAKGQLQKEVDKAEHDMLEARIIYLIRHHVVEDVLTLDPILKAVHADPSGGSRERDLHRLIDQRDVLSLTHGNIAKNAKEIQNQLMTTQVQSIQVVEENQKLAHDLRTVASQLRRKDLSHVEDAELKSELEEAKSDLSKAKRRRDLIKGVVSAMVTGSGVDWSLEDRLLRLVLEEEV